MIIRKKHVNWLVILFFFAIIAVVFQQIFTSMEQQGIASGGPYDNAAAYPSSVAILIGIMIFAQLIFDRFKADKKDGSEKINVAELRRPMALLVIFGIYLSLLGVLGYHLTTAPMIFAIMVLCGMRRLFQISLTAIALSFSLAFFFEFFLKIVLPGGMFGLNIPW